MTVSDTTRRTKVLGDGAIVAFTFDFPVFNSSNILVYKIDTTTLVATLQTISTDYTVALNAVTEGGTVTYVVAPTTSEYSFILRVMTKDQQTGFPTAGVFPEVAVENAFDKVSMIDIEMQEELDRCIKFADSSDLSSMVFPEGTGASNRASKVIAYDSAGTALELISTTSITNTDPLAVTGDLVQYGTSAVEKLAIGSIGQFLGVAAGKSAWSELFVKGGDLVAAGTLVVDTDGLAFDVTGNTTITDFSGMSVSQMVLLRFDGTPLLTHSADLYLPNATNIQCIAGDIGLFHCHATDDVRLVAWGGHTLAHTHLTAAQGGTLSGVNPYTVLPAETDATNGGADDYTEIDFTSIPSGIKKLTILFADVSISGVDEILIQIGDTGGLDTTGYKSGVVYLVTGSHVGATSGYQVISVGAAADVLNGKVELTLVDSTSNTWLSKGLLYANTGSNFFFASSGIHSLTAVLDRVRITTLSGSDTFDGGTVNVMYE